jgi:hypothetical protein
MHHDAKGSQGPARSCQPKHASCVEWGKENVEEPLMNLLTKLLILGIFGASLSGCVVTPAGRAYVAAPAPVVVVRPYGYYGYYGPR